MQEYRNTDTPTIHNTGKAFENTVYQLTKKLVEEGSFLVSQPNAVVEKGKNITQETERLIFKLMYLLKSIFRHKMKFLLV